MPGEPGPSPVYGGSGSPWYYGAGGPGAAGGGVGVGGYGGVPNEDPGSVISSQLGYLPQINQANLNYLGQGVPNFAALTGRESNNIASLLNPTDTTDISRIAAEQNVGMGVSGSPFGVMNTARLTQNDQIAREQAGSQMLSGAVARLPKPFDPANLIYNSPKPLAGGPPGGGGGGGQTLALWPPALPARQPVVSPGDQPPMIAPGTSSTGNILSSILGSYLGPSYNPFTAPPNWTPDANAGANYSPDVPYSPNPDYQSPPNPTDPNSDYGAGGGNSIFPDWVQGNYE